MSLKSFLRGALTLVVGVGGALAPATIWGQTPVEAFRLSFDIPADFGGGIILDGTLVEERAGSISLTALGLIPADVDIDAYHMRVDGAHLMSFDVTTDLPGLGSVGPADIVLFDGSAYALEFQASSFRIPDGVNVDSLTMATNGDLILSFDQAVELGGVVVQDKDLARLHGGFWNVFLDGEQVGIANGLDLDAAHLVPESSHLLLSFDGSGTVGGTSFDDEDVIEYKPESGSWNLFWDGSSLQTDLSLADLDAVYALSVRPSAIFLDGFENGSLTNWSSELP